MKRIFLWLTAATLLTATSCKKDPVASTPPEAKMDKRLPETAEEKDQAARIQAITPILKEVCKNKEAVKEIAALIKGGYYTDERILVRDLMNPDKSAAYKTKALDGLSFPRGAFKRAFQQMAPAAARRNNTGARTLDDYTFQNNDVAIYFPYSEVHQLPDYITLAPAEYESNQGEGFYITDLTEYQVSVNDDYAYQNPTYIITTGAEIMCTNPYWCNPPLDPNVPPGLNLRRVQIGWIRTNQNLDRLFGTNKDNSGGNEVMVCRTDAYLKHDADGQITQFASQRRQDFTRLEGRNSTWLKWHIDWDDNWEPNNDEQVISVYEADSKGTIEWTGELSTTIKKKINGADVEVKGSIGFKHTERSEDAISFTQEYTWNSYVGAARNQASQWGFDLKPIKNNSFFNGPATYIWNFASGTARDNAYLPNGEFWPIQKMGVAADITWPYQLVQ